MEQSIRILLTKYVNQIREYSTTQKQHLVDGLVVDFLLVYSGHRPAFYMEEKALYTNRNFITRLKRLNIVGIVVGPYFDNNDQVCVIINLGHIERVWRKLRQLPRLLPTDPKKHVLIGQILGYDCPGLEYLDRSQQKLHIMFAFQQQQSTTYHMGAICPLDLSNRYLRRVVKRLTAITNDPLFKNYSVRAVWGVGIE